MRVRAPSAAAGRALAGVAVVAFVGSSRSPTRCGASSTSSSRRSSTRRTTRTTCQSHLFSSNGSGRWQFWHAALDEFRSSRSRGRGAGSYQSWWAQHGSLAGLRPRRALALPREARRARARRARAAPRARSARARGWLAPAPTADGRDARASPRRAGAAFVAYRVAAGIDWLWELPAVSVVGIACLALITGAATDAGGRAAARRRGRGAARPRSRSVVARRRADRRRADPAPRATAR